MARLRSSRSLILLPLFGVLLTCTLAASILSAEIRFKRADFGSGGGVKLATILVRFDKDLSLIDVRDKTRKPLAQITGVVPPTDGGDTGTPAMIAAGEGIAELVCRTAKISTPIPALGSLSGPPTFLLTSHGYPDPAPGILSVFGGYKTESNPPSDAIAFGILMSYEPCCEPSAYFYTEEDLRACNGGAGPKIVFKNSNLQDSSGAAVTGEVVVKTVVSDVCTREGMLALYTSFQTFLDVVRTSDGTLTFNAVQFGMAAYSARESFQGCLNLLKSLWTSRQESRKVLTAECPYAPTEAEWKLDPCCNKALQLDYCCAPRLVTKTIDVVQAPNSELINSKCQHPKIVNFIISDYVDQLLTQPAELSIDLSKATDNLMEFYHDCNARLIAPCHTNSDCLEGSFCNLNQNFCVESYSSITSYLKCLYENAPPTVLRQLKVQFQIPATSGLAEFSSAMNKFAVKSDCVGPTADNYREKIVQTVNDDGVKVYGLVPGDRIACLSDMACNWNHQIKDKAKCEAHPSPNFCGDCGYDGKANECWERSRFPHCYIYVPEYSEATCTFFGGTFLDGQCLTMSATLAQCQSLPICTGGVDCGFSFCYSTNPSDLTTCTSFPGGKVVAGTHCVWDLGFVDVTKLSSVCTEHGSGGQPWIGRNFVPGELATIAACTLGVCTANDAPLALASCKALATCTTECWGCITYQWDMQAGVCVDEQIINSVDCYSSVVGTTYGNWNEKFLRCYYAIPESECILPHKFVTCDGYDRSTCGQSEDHQFLQCSFNRHRCRDSSECLSQGRCNDDEFVSWVPDPAHSGSYIQRLGTCLIPATESHGDGSPNCREMGSEGDFEYSRFPGMCRSTAIVTEADCSKAGGKWVLPAKDEAECLKHGEICLADGRVSRLSAVDCAACGGERKPLYTYTKGEWLPATLRPLEWRARKWVSRNQWLPTISRATIEQVIRGAATRAVSREFSRLISERYGNLIELIRGIACDCSGSGAKDCFAVLSKSLLSSEEFTAGEDVRVDTTAGSVLLRVEDIIGAGSVDVSKIFASAILAAGESPAVKRQEKGDYTVVRNQKGDVVGQISGNGLDVAYTGAKQADVTLPTRGDIPKDPSYTVKGVGVIQPDGTVEVYTDSVQSDDSGVSTTVTESGAYVPILLDPSWENPPPPTSTLPPTTSPNPIPNPTGTNPTSTEPVLDGSYALTVSFGMFVLVVVTIAL